MFEIVLDDEETGDELVLYFGVLGTCHADDGGEGGGGGVAEDPESRMGLRVLLDIGIESRG